MFGGNLGLIFRKQIAATFAALAKQHNGVLGKQEALQLLSTVGMEGKEKQEAADLLWSEMRLAEDAHITEVNTLCLCPCLFGAGPYLPTAYLLGRRACHIQSK